MMKIKSLIISVILTNALFEVNCQEIGVHYLNYCTEPFDKSTSEIDSGYYELNLGCLNQLDSIHLNSKYTLDRQICSNWFKSYNIQVYSEKDYLKSVVVTYLEGQNNEDSFWVDSVVCHSKDSCELYRMNEISDYQYQLEQIITFEENKMTVREALDYLDRTGENEQKVLLFDSLNYCASEYEFNSGFLIQYTSAIIEDGKRTNEWQRTVNYEYFTFQNSIFTISMGYDELIKRFSIFTFDNASDIEKITKLTLLGIKGQFYGNYVNAILPFMLIHFPELMEKIR